MAAMVWEPWRSKLWFLMILPLLLIFIQVDKACARQIGEAAKSREKDAVLELTTETFNSSLWAAPATWAVVEFYAHWCPACQNFKSHYDRVAHLFGGVDAVYPGIVLLARVDCAEQINKNLCQRFAVDRYPTLLWGKPATFAWGSRLDGTAESVERIETSFNAQSLLDWINTRLGRSYSLDPTTQKKQSRQVTGQLVASIHDIEEATAEAYDIILDNKLVTPKYRAPFVQFLQLLAVHHPSRRCRAGSAEILSNLMDAWPAEHVMEADEHVTGTNNDVSMADIKALRQFHVCGEGIPTGTYKSCSTVTGGYSCGLWYLFHALSVRVDDSESSSAVKTIRDFVRYFFICEECREHFLKMSESAIGAVSSRRALALWLWRAHNEVNSRLSKEAADLSLELPAPKVQWPPKQMCTSCRTVSNRNHGTSSEEIEWDEEMVYLFLRKIYWQSLAAVADETKSMGTKQLNKGGEVHKDVDDGVTNAVAVPMGAAIGIAIASCGFGLAACCWRLQQKKSKYCSHCTPWPF